MKRSGFGIALLVAFGCLSDGADAQKVKTTPVLGTFRCAEPGGLSGVQQETAFEATETSTHIRRSSDRAATR